MKGRGKEEIFNMEEKMSRMHGILKVREERRGKGREGKTCLNFYFTLFALMESRGGRGEGS